MLNDEVYLYDRATFIAATVDLPVIGQVIEATAGRPYLGIKIAVDPREIATLLVEAQLPPVAEPAPGRGLFVPLRAEDLAGKANMSASSFHEHFRAVTAMSPLQFQKQLRLQEARRLLLVEAMDAASAGHRVGYGSPSQFSREYSRLFGVPPAADMRRLRKASRAAALA